MQERRNEQYTRGMRPRLLLVGGCVALLALVLAVERLQRAPAPGAAPNTDTRSVDSPDSPDSDRELRSLTDRLARLETLELARVPEPDPRDSQGASSPAIDREWEAIPRNRSSITGAFCLAPGSLTVERLVRNSALNPRDEFIPKIGRDDLSALLQAYQAHLEQLSQITGAAHQAKLIALARDGALLPLSAALANLGPEALADVDQEVSDMKRLHALGEKDVSDASIRQAILTRRAKDALGADGVLMDSEGAMMLAVPGSVRGMEAYREHGIHARTSFLASVTAWFVRHEVLTEHEAIEILRGFDGSCAKLTTTRSDRSMSAR